MKKLIGMMCMLCALFAGSAWAQTFPAARILFDSGKTEIDAAGQAAIGKVAEYLDAHTDARVQLSGFTDSSGNAAHNEALAKQRAQVVRDALIAAGASEGVVLLVKPAQSEQGNADEARAVAITLAAAPVVEGVVEPGPGVVAAGVPVTAVAVKAEAATAPVSALDTGDTAWMLTSTLLVILMIAPGLALFYGGLARSKNMLSVLIQVFTIFSLVSVLWALYGFSLVFTEGNAVIGGFGLAFLAGITPDTLSGTLPTIPEYVFIAFQGTFAAITTALMVGAFAERARFGAVMIAAAIWFTLSYLPIAHMVWGGGLLAEDGALDFAGGAVVHINAGVGGLVGAWLVGKRIGYGREAFTPHSLTLTMVGASLLWVGWFGFNAGSAGGANNIAGLAFINTVLATAAGTLSWLVVEALLKGKASMLGAASGAIAGLVAITPAAGFVAPMAAIVMGLIVSPFCVWGVSGLKRLLRVDDAFDAFGIHGVGGIVGAILTGVFAAQSLGGTGGLDPDSFAMGTQVWVQVKSVLITIVWSAVAALIAFKLADLILGLRVSEEAERQGLDISSHGETAYNR